ncbi:MULTISPECIES: conjugative transposon protein TraK [Capnocytophaga]|jgi:conjugative transposon TraK protein|uniref:Conjugative transposon protein TraK n=3 Tax=Capnocytophaga TaxID=1016 RepID=A0A250F067_CAPSP|nr:MULTISPECIES: conjugative transposon protein TraK [Capnocytophaga]ASF44244.1 conjugative transposon protein TraK [Capnocytophaga endodontalis]ATA78522.1 conjugative transposon protein TraK [Capnocytophaga sputigena]EKY08246.1 conjugative transposon TraK protein [Capnocytophaga sp. oral taxon 380 str. F0488]EPE00988.1 conjugative transposon TraK protein [Capnocytophaga sp. oral taxon 336 str. F0502]MBM0650947.1 conjugative transposon protein TraK [Capnocytophaga genosp. AHN8471]
MIVKNIEKRIKINKTMAIATVIFAIVIVIVGFSYSYKIVQDSRKSIYILDNGVPVLVKQTDELLNRPVEYKAQVELFHRLFFTLAPDDEYINKNIDKALYLMDDSAKKERSNLTEKGWYNQIISSNATVSIQTDSINIDLNSKRFMYYGTQMINRKTSLIIRKLITQGTFRDIPRTPNNAHGVLLENWNILDNTELSVKQKYSY